MIRTIIFTLATLSSILAEPPSTRYISPPSSSGSHSDYAEPKTQRGFSTLSDSGFDATSFGSGPSYSSSSASDGYSSSGYSHSSSLGSSSGGYSSSPVGAYSNSFAAPSPTYSSSGFSPSTYSSSPSIGYSANYGSSGYSSSSAGYSSGHTRGQARPAKQVQSFSAAPSYPSGSAAYATPLSHNEVEEQTDPSDPIKYEYTYEVNAPESGTEFGHRESRTGGVTQGQYHVLLPDGRLQTVDYLADKAGYRPTVTYQQTDRVATATQPQQQIYSRAQQGTPVTSAGYTSLSVPQTSHGGSSLVRQATRSASAYSPVQRQPVYSVADYHSKTIERASQHADSTSNTSA